MGCRQTFPNVPTPIQIHIKKRCFYYVKDKLERYKEDADDNKRDITLVNEKEALLNKTELPKCIRSSSDFQVDIIVSNSHKKYAKVSADKSVDGEQKAHYSHHDTIQTITPFRSLSSRKSTAIKNDRKFVEPICNRYQLPSTDKPSLLYNSYTLKPDITRKINEWRDVVRSFLKWGNKNRYLDKEVSGTSCSLLRSDDCILQPSTSELKDSNSSVLWISLSNPEILNRSNKSHTSVSAVGIQKFEDLTLTNNVSVEKVILKKLTSEKDEPKWQSSLKSVSSSCFGSVVLPLAPIRRLSSSSQSLFSPGTPSSTSNSGTSFKSSSTAIASSFHYDDPNPHLISEQGNGALFKKDFIPRLRVYSNYSAAFLSEEDWMKRQELKERLIQAATLGNVEEVYVLTLMGSSGLNKARDCAMRNHFGELATELVSGCKRKELFALYCLSLSQSFRPPISLFYKCIWEIVAEMCIDISGDLPRLSVRRKGVSF